MDQEGKTGSGGFWTSLPAILGSITALVTAIGGIFLVTNKGGDEPPAAPANAQTAVSAPAPVSAPAAAAPTSLDISGRWETSEGVVKFRVADSRDDEGRPVKEVRGTYGNARIEGLLQGSTLEGYFSGDENESECDSERNGSPHWGRVEFNFNPVGDKFKGYWGACDAEPTERWTGARG